jgi:Nucleotidyl transferase of unknown function (DUF2204)
MGMIESTTDRYGEPHERLYVRMLRGLTVANVPFLLGGSFAFTHYTGIVRSTKDVDLFIRERDRERVLGAFEAMGFTTSVPFPHWLAKVACGELKLDVIWASGNGVAKVDDEWFQYARDAKLYDVPVRLMPPEEMLWSKAFIMERERYDGADVAHLLHAQGRSLDWPRLIRRFGPHLPVLLSHVILFRFSYSDAPARVPTELLDELFELTLEQLEQDQGEKTCRGTLLSREQYLLDVYMRGYADGRLADGVMTPEQVRVWTAAIAEERNQAAGCLPQDASVVDVGVLS